MAETATIVFPDGFLPEIGGYDKSVVHATAISTSDTGKEQRRFKFPDLGYMQFRFRTLPLTDLQQIHDFRSFLQSLRGAYNPFLFLEPQSEWFKSEEIGITDGSSTLVTEWHGLNSWSTESGHTAALEVNGGDVDYAINSPTYPDANEVGWLTVDPPAGQSVVLWNFYGRRRYICRLLSEQISYVPVFQGQVKITDDPLYPAVPILATQYEITFKQVR